MVGDRKEVVEAITARTTISFSHDGSVKPAGGYRSLFEGDPERLKKLRRRDEIFQSLRDEFNDVKEQLKTDSYREFGKKRSIMPFCWPTTGTSINSKGFKPPLIVWMGPEKGSFDSLRKCNR